MKLVAIVGSNASFSYNRLLLQFIKERFGQAFALVQSILRKADFQPQAAENYQLNDTESWEIIKLIQDFPNTIVKAADNFEPSLIARFAIHLKAIKSTLKHRKIKEYNL